MLKRGGGREKSRNGGERRGKSGKVGRGEERMREKESRRAERGREVDCFQERRAGDKSPLSSGLENKTGVEENIPGTDTAVKSPCPPAPLSHSHTQALVHVHTHIV